MLTNVTAAQTVTAHYTLDSYPITVNASPTSGGTVSCTPNPVPHGDDVTCIQTPNPGYTFTGWGGDCSGTGACVLTNVTGPLTVSASFAMVTITQVPALGWPALLLLLALMLVPAWLFGRGTR